MIYSLVLLMLIKYTVVSWSNDYVWNRETFKRQLEITSTFLVCLLAFALAAYIVNYPQDWDLRYVYVMLGYLFLDGLLLKGHVMLTAIAFRYFYGNAKMKAYRLRRVGMLLQPVTMGFYCIVGVGIVTSF